MFDIGNVQAKNPALGALNTYRLPLSAIRIAVAKIRGENGRSGGAVDLADR